MKDILIHTFKKVFMSRKGLTWFSNWVCDIGLTTFLVFFAIFGDKDKLEMMFWLIMACKLMQLIVLGLIAFDKIKVEIKK